MPAFKPLLILLFLLCALPTCLFMAMVTPLGQVPDEPAHFARADGLLHGAILGTRKPALDKDTGKITTTSGVKVDAGLFKAAFGNVTPSGIGAIVTAQNYADARSQKPDHSTIFANIPNTDTYFPIPYTPAAAGLALGLALNLSPFLCLILGRITAAAAFLALGATALRIAAYGEAFILAILLLPMTLFLAGSLNEDGILIATSCLAAAALTRDSAREPKYRYLALASLAVVLAAKPPYLPLLALGLVPVLAPHPTRRAGLVALAALPVLLWVAIIITTVVVPFERAPYHPGPLFAGPPTTSLTATNPSANLHILLAHPSLFITLPLGVITLWGHQIGGQMLGVLGLLNLELPRRVYRAWTIALAIAGAGLLLRPPSPAQKTSLADSAWTITVLLLTCWLVCISFYLSWTDVGQTYIEGVQGRYALVVLPFLIIAAPAPWRTIPLPPILPALPALALAVFDLGYLPTKIIWFFYIH